MGLAGPILESLKSRGFSQPTPIQQKAIPIAVSGKDIIGIAQTGTGKTLAFGLPLIQHVLEKHGQALVVLPTRELALQVDESLRNIGRSLGIRTAVVIGGAPIYRQKMELRQNPQVIIGTPGRLIDHLEQRTLNLNNTTFLVLDEADRMLDMGFAPQIQRILQGVSKNHQTLLFSATMPSGIARIAERSMQSPLRVEIAPAGTAAERVVQEFFMIPRERKQQFVDHLLTNNEGSVLIFTRTKHYAKRLTQNIRLMGYKATEIHGNRSLGQRRDALAGFKDGRYRVLVATDIAARGIDVAGIGHVVNYDVPEDSDDYVHRIGRTGRAGLAGHAVTLVQPDQRNKLREIERLVRKSIVLSDLPDLPPVRDNFSAPQAELNTQTSIQVANNERPAQKNFKHRWHHRNSRSNNKYYSRGVITR